jgi:hypothetical protein
MSRRFVAIVHILTLNSLGRVFARLTGKVFHYAGRFGGGCLRDFMRLIEVMVRFSSYFANYLSRSPSAFSASFHRLIQKSNRPTGTRGYY